MISGRLFCAGLVLTILSCGYVFGQGTNDAPAKQLYLLAGTSTPSYSTETFPANLYQVSASSKLKLIREVIPQKDGFIGVYAAGDVLFLPNLEGAVSIIHTNEPGLVDDVVFDSQRLIPAYMGIVAAEPPGMPADLLIPLGEPPTDPPTPLKGKLISVSSSPGGATPRIRFDAWDEYKAARFDGQPGGPVLGPGGLWGTAAGNDLAISLIGHSISVDALPPSFRGGKDKFSVLASSQRYVLIGRIPPRGEEHPQKTWDVFVHDRMRENWKTIQEAEGPSRLFGPWLATRVTVSLQIAKPSPGRENERNYGTTSLPNVREEYDSSPYKFWRSGEQILQNLEDGRTIRIETNQEDSEILSVARDQVLYRVNDAIYQAKIVGDKLQNASLVVKDEDIPEIHWVFWEPPVQSATATDSAAPSGPPAQVDLNDQGLNLMKRGDYKNASAKFLEAISLDPRNAMYADNAGFAFYKMRDFENAIKYFKSFTDLDPKRAVAYLNLGDAYVKTNQPAEARQAYSKYLELAPNSKSAPDVKQKLESLPTSGLPVPPTSDSDRWAVRDPERNNGSYYPNGIEKTDCGPLPHFLKYSTTKDSVTLRRVGAINGFAIDDVIRIDGTKFGDTKYKMILVERTRGEFCDIYFEQNTNLVLKNFEPSYFVNVESQRVLVSRDPIDGNCGCFSEGDWIFDKDGPIFLGVSNVIDEALQKLLPPGAELWHGEGFDIRTLTFSYGFQNGTEGGIIRLKFALKDHKLVLVSHEFGDDGNDSQPTPPAGAPTRIKQGADVTAASIIDHIAPVYPDLAQRARIQGNVVLHAIIDKEGKVAQLEVISGHPLLVQAAIDAARQWRYAPTVLNGSPVEVDTTITVPFALGEQKP